MTFWDFATFHPFVGAALIVIATGLAVMTQQLCMSFIDTIEVCVLRICDAWLNINGFENEEEIEQ